MIVQDLNEQAMALNLSYVLREPSSSKHVRRALREARRFARRRARLLRAFGNLSGEAFQSNLLIHPELTRQLGRHRHIGSVYSVSAGLHELLPRAVLQAVQLSETSSPVLIDAAEAANGRSSIHLFGHPVQAPDIHSGSADRATLVAGLIVRPGESTLMLVGDFMGKHGDPEKNLSRAFESIIRDYTDQWLPARALWESPLECADPTIIEDQRSAGGR